MRQLGEPVTGEELYPEIHRVFGFVTPQSVVRLFQRHGYAAAAYSGNMDTLKRRLTDGVPVIALIRIPGDTHYVAVVGYDEEFIYLADSIEENAEPSGGGYNRTLSIEAFEAAWKTEIYPVKNVYIVISGQKERI